MGMGLVGVVERAHSIGASAIQIFSDNPTSWRRRPEAPQEAAAFRQRLLDLDIGPVAIHAPYLVNLAGHDETLFGKSVELMGHELAHAADFSARFVNVHTGSHRGSGVGKGIARLVEGLERATDDPAQGESAPGGSSSRGSAGAFGSGHLPLVVLENSSGGGDAIGVTIEELAAILDTAAARGIDDRIGFCLDVAHLWGAGYDVADPVEIDNLLDRFDRLIVISRLVMVHLNDSVSSKGSRHDRHAGLGDGQIGRDGLAHFLCHPKLDHVTYYLETPGMEVGMDAVNIARLGDMVSGRPLTGANPAAGADVAGETAANPAAAAPLDLAKPAPGGAPA
jgi:deoxyribonuclease-4